MNKRLDIYLTLILVCLGLLLSSCLTGGAGGEGGVGFQYDTPTPLPTETPAVTDTPQPTQTPFPTYTPYPSPEPPVVLTPAPPDVVLTVQKTTRIPDDAQAPTGSWERVIIKVTLHNKSNRPVQVDVVLRSVGTGRLWRRDPTVNDVLADTILGTKLEPNEIITGEAGYRVWPSVYESGLVAVLFELTEIEGVALPD